ncbi:MAG: outer membrane protein assembly factor BamC [Gammaproteobacteria bacterium]
MINRHLPVWMVGFTLASTLSSCSTIKSWFPDKERDYRFTAEIPELSIPEDMKNAGLESLSRPLPAPVGTVQTVPDSVLPEESGIQQNSPVQPEGPESAAKSEEPVAAETQATSVTEASPGASISTLQIDQAKMPAARLVGKALTRKHVEIVERNIDRGYYYVKFDPNAVAAKDESIWDEFIFLFGDDPSQEQEYRIAVRQVNEQLSEVTVQDSGGKMLSNAVANALLKLITDGINEDISAATSEDDTTEAKESVAPDAPADQK